MDCISTSGSTEPFELLTAIYFPKLWSPSDPFLYRIGITMTAADKNGTIQDSLDVMSAFREFRIGDNGEYRLNGRHIELVTTEIDALHEIMTARENGYNSVRIASSLIDAESLRFCDETGILAHLSCDFTKDPSGTALNDMILACRNHPSIVAWNLPGLNDVNDENIRAIRKMDVARLVTLDDGKFSNPYVNRWQKNRN
jgi:beta-galactosidase/beta-glucuronidase